MSQKVETKNTKEAGTESTREALAEGAYEIKTENSEEKRGEEKEVFKDPSYGLRRWRALRLDKGYTCQNLH